MNLINFKRARGFIYRNARPLDLARWRFLFEGAGKEDVLWAMAAYQNEDGGFGHALEPDCWNPESAPMQTWVATKLLREINFCDRKHPVVAGILRYLASGKDFDGRQWAWSIPTNNSNPHAPWWSHDPDAEPAYNPTASLIAFILMTADRESELFTLARKLAIEAYDYLKKHWLAHSMHTVAGYVDLYEALMERSVSDLVDMEEFEALLQKQIADVLSPDVSAWETEYVCKPSLFISSKESSFYPKNKALCDAECRFITDNQEADGSWKINWDWADYRDQWCIARNWWKADVIIRNILFLRAIRAN